MNEDAAIESWKETRVSPAKTSNWMTPTERTRDAAMLAAGVPQCVRDGARRSFAETYAALRAVRS